MKDRRTLIALLGVLVVVGGGAYFWLGGSSGTQSGPSGVTNATARPTDGETVGDLRSTPVRNKGQSSGSDPGRRLTAETEDQRATVGGSTDSKRDPNKGKRSRDRGRSKKPPTQEAEEEQERKPRRKPVQAAPN